MFRFQLRHTPSIGDALCTGVRTRDAADTSGRRPRDRPLRLRFHGAVALGWLALVIYGLALPSLPRPLAEATGAFSRSLGGLLSASTAWTPVSVSEIVDFLTFGVVSVLVIRALAEVARRRRRGRNVLACGALWSLTVVLLLSTEAYVAWVLGRPLTPLPERLGWATSDEANADIPVPGETELSALCAELVAATNHAYLEAFHTDDLGRPSAPPTPSKLDEAVEDGYRAATAHLGLPGAFARSRGPAKPVAFSEFLCLTHTLGYYDPLTGEANYNRLMPASMLPQTLAHEKAHQRSVFREDEAEFFGYMACILSDDPYARYSGYLFAQEVLLCELARLNPEAARNLAGRRLPGVRRDVEAQIEFHETYAGPVSLASRLVVDLCLKVAGDKHGIDSYQRSALLIVGYARHRGGSCASQVADSESFTHRQETDDGSSRRPLVAPHDDELLPFGSADAHR